MQAVPLNRNVIGQRVYRSEKISFRHRFRLLNDALYGCAILMTGPAYSLWYYDKAEIQLPADLVFGFMNMYDFRLRCCRYVAGFSHS